MELRAAFTDWNQPYWDSKNDGKSEAELLDALIRITKALRSLVSD